MNPCDQATRPHEHHEPLLQPGQAKITWYITAYARDRSWKVVIRDDGSICRRDVEPTPAKYPPEQVIPFLLDGLGHNERVRRRENPRYVRRARKRG